MNVAKNAFTVAMLAMMVACGEIRPKGKIESVNTKISDFENVSLKGKFRAFYVHSDSSFVNIETYKNIGNNLKVDVSNNILTIAEKRPTKNVDFYAVTIYSKYHPAKVSISDSVEFNASSAIKTDAFVLNLKNFGKFIGSVDAQNASVSMEGASLANFKGFTKKARLSLKDSAMINAPYWILDHLEIEMRNKTYADLNVKDSIKGKIEDDSKFVYYNDPIRAFNIGKKANVQNKNLD